MTSPASAPSSATRPTPSRPPIAGSGGITPPSPVRVRTSAGLIGAVRTSTSACPALSLGVSNSTASNTSCGTGPRRTYRALSIGLPTLKCACRRRKRGRAVRRTDPPGTRPHHDARSNRLCGSRPPATSRSRPGTASNASITKATLPELLRGKRGPSPAQSALLLYVSSAAPRVSEIGRRSRRPARSKSTAGAEPPGATTASCRPLRRRRL
jgi:hypothetical protein